MTKSTGRYIIVNDKTYVVEPILPRGFRTKWEAADPHRGGAVPEHESIVKPENGFINIIDLPPGQSPSEYLRRQRNAEEP